MHLEKLHEEMNFSIRAKSFSSTTLPSHTSPSPSERYESSGRDENVLGRIYAVIASESRHYFLLSPLLQEQKGLLILET